jgi:hypothetical protein
MAARKKKPRRRAARAKRTAGGAARRARGRKRGQRAKRSKSAARKPRAHACTAAASARNEPGSRARRKPRIQARSARRASEAATTATFALDTPPLVPTAELSREPEPADDAATTAQAELAAGGEPVRPDPIPARFAAALAVLASEPVRAAVVRRYFRRAGAALVRIEQPIALGDRVHVRGVTSDFLASVTSLRVAGAPIARATAGEATLGLPERARAGDVVYALRPPA